VSRGEARPSWSRAATPDRSSGALHGGKEPSPQAGAGGCDVFRAERSCVSLPCGRRKRKELGEQLGPTRTCVHPVQCMHVSIFKNKWGPRTWLKHDVV
jgi:hypothetical protein